MKVTQHAEPLDAVQVTFRRNGAWPEWLQGQIAVCSGDGEHGVAPVKNGDYLVDRAGVVDVLSPEEFAKEFRPVRRAKAKRTDGDV